MSEQAENKKRRIIHWDPEHGNKRQTNKWTPLRILGWTLGGFVALLLVAGVVIRGIKLVAGPDVFSRAASAVKSANPTAESAGNAFVSQSKAELSRETASKALAELQKLPLDHDSLVQRFVLIQKAMLHGDALLDSRDYADAFQVFDELNRHIDAFANDVRLKGETQKAYDEVLSRIKDLDMARSLTPKEFETAFSDAGTGRQLFMQGSFVMAKKEFDRAFAALDRAQAALQAYVDDNLRRGQEAIAAGQRDVALAAFKAALEKDPSNEAGALGLKRAEVADRVHSLLQQAAALEEKKEYAEAAKLYGKAFEVDAFSAVAQQGKARAERLEKETAFNTALAAAVAARDQKDWPKAIAEYERALKVDPKKDDVKKALAEVRDTAHKEAVKKALAKGFEYENKYEWENARAAYYETIKLDGEHTEAKEGYTRSGRMLRLLLQYDKLIEIAEQHAQKAEFAAGIRVFNEAVAIKPAYLALSDKVQQLRDTLVAQSQPMAVTFQSDGDTWVSITNFKMLGKIRSETLNILPGDYEIIGRRKGFQDVVLMLQVRQGTPPPVVSVVCKLRANG
jgi:tetratricopeptide (TPR) repeat protein